MSGAGTNAGIEFQHRIGAVALTAMLVDLGGMAWLLGESETSEIRTVRFETADSIDDLVVETDGPRYLVQAKRSLSLSASEGGDLSSVVSQFVDQFVGTRDADDRYVIATSTNSSRRITVEFRKLTEAARLNELGPTDNPLTQSEQGVLDIVRTLAARHYLARAGTEMPDEDFVELLRRIHVTTPDVESGGTVERTILLVLASSVSTVAGLVWSNLISLALTLASKRLSIDRAAIAERFQDHLGPRAIAREGGEDGLMLDDKNPLPAGRDVVLMEFDQKLLVMEMARFSDEGERRLVFENGELQTPGGVRGRVLLRTATWVGLMRAIELTPDLVGQKDEVVIAQISDDAPDPELSSWAEAHAALLADRLRLNPARRSCLTCGRPIPGGAGLCVEIDEVGVPHEVGLVHAACHRPTHRVIGAIAGGMDVPIPDLTDFDIRSWVASLPTGQGLFAGSSDSVRGSVVRIGWKPGRTHLRVGNWGIAYKDETGAVHHVVERMQVMRHTEAEARSSAIAMKAWIDKQEQAGDPISVAGGDEGFGPYSTLLRTHPGRPIDRVIDMWPTELSRATIEAYRKVDNFYAPVVVLHDATSGAVFELGDAVAMLTDPLRLPRVLDNWRRAGIEVPRLTTSVVRSDDQFDALVSASFARGVGVLVDPLLGHDGKLATGFIVDDFSAIS